MNHAMLDLAPGDPATKNVPVPILNDSFDEPAEDLTLTLTSPTNAVLSANTSATGVIQDDDATVISVATPPTVTESTGPLSFPVSITGANPAVSYTVHVSTSDGTATVGADYTGVTQTLTWNAGDSAAKHRDATVAAWAVAHSAAHGITSVTIGSREWRADRDGWHDAKTPAPGGSVVMTVTSTASR